MEKIYRGTVEYYDSRDGEWYLIEQISGDCYGDVIYWDVQDALFGQGFKLRAKVFDLFENESAYVEWGPFEIVDVTPPDTEAPVINIFEMYGGNLSQLETNETYIFSIGGTDDYGLDTVDFYYYEPQGDSWVYAVEAVVTRIHSEYIRVTWTVPNNLLGENYKLKVIAFDESGKASNTLEYGPVTIIDGTSPSFTITRPIETDIYNLGDTLSLEWNTVSVHDTHIYDVDIINAGRDSQIDYNIDNTSTYQWTIPMDAALAGEQVQLYIRGKDLVNKEWGDAYSAPFEIIDNSPKPVDPWEYPERITENNIFTQTGVNTMIFCV